MDVSLCSSPKQLCPSCSVKIKKLGAAKRGSPSAYIDRRIKTVGQEEYLDYYLFPKMDKAKDFLFFLH